MSRILRLLAVIVFIALIACLWFWWNQPQRVDMAAYVPADSLVYLEANSLTDVAAAITGTDGWHQLEPHFGGKTPRYQGWLTAFHRISGIGPAPAVIAVRAQAAFVLLDLRATSSGDTLEYKPRAALVVETHTSGSRVQPAIEKIIGGLAQRAYGSPRFDRANVGGSEFARWLAPDSERRIVASFEGSVVFVGNDEQAVLACLAAKRGERPSLLHLPELEETRARLHAKQALAFGYVSSTNAARLLSDGAPILIGKLAEGAQIQKLIAAGASKVLGNLGWSAQSFRGGIEDTYLLSLKPEVIAHLRGAFDSADNRLHAALDFLPADTYSVTHYNLRNPSAAWESLGGAVSAQVDALSAIIFTAGFKALLAPYGIDEPAGFLRSIKSEVVTVRLGEYSERAVLIAGVGDANALRQFIARRFGPNARTEKVADVDVTFSADGEYAATFANGYFLLGPPGDVRRCLDARAANNTLASSSLKQAALSHYLDERPAPIVTYTKNAAPLGALIATLAAKNDPSNEGKAMTRIIADFPYDTTETTLGENGFERTTRSAFGQFPSLLSPLVKASNATKE